MIGELAVLNVYGGDVTIKFDKDDEEELKKAKEMIKDMLKRGYLLFVEEPDGSHKPVKRFSAKRDCYIIKDLPGEEKERPLKKTKTIAVPRTSGG